MSPAASAPLQLLPPRSLFGSRLASLGACLAPNAHRATTAAVALFKAAPLAYCRGPSGPRGRRGRLTSAASSPATSASGSWLSATAAAAAGASRSPRAATIAYLICLRAWLSFLVLSSLFILIYFMVMSRAPSFSCFQNGSRKNSPREKLAGACVHTRDAFHRRVSPTRVPKPADA